MARTRSPLAATYGSLTVIADYGGDSAMVQCTCGRQKWVLRSNLRAGRIKSCGSPGCRPYANRSPLPADAPTWLPPSAIPSVIAMVDEVGVEIAAQQMGRPQADVHALVNACVARGGVEAYVDYLTGRKGRRKAPAAPAAPDPAAAPAEPDAPADGLTLGVAPAAPPSRWSP